MRSNKRVYLNIMMIIVVSFLGFIFEDVFLAFTHGFFDNRNMGLPFLLGYGVLVDIIYLTIGTPKNIKFFKKNLNINNEILRRTIYLVLSMLFVSFGEVFLGSVVEKTCNVVWWNYTHIPFHFTKYTSLPTSLGFGILITILMDFIFVPIYNYFSKWSLSTLQLVSTILISLLTLDYLINAIKIYKFQKLKPIWRIYVNGRKPNILPFR